MIRRLGYRSQTNPLQEIKQILFKNRNRDEEYFLFGSRARGDADNRSDYDIAISTKDGKKLPLFRSIRLQAQLNELPWKVDLIDLTRVSQSFKNIISTDMISLM